MLSTERLQSTPSPATSPRIDHALAEQSLLELTRENDRLYFPRIQTGVLTQLFRNADRRELPGILWQAADVMELPAKILNLDGKPVPLPGVYGSVMNVSDCFTGQDAETLGRNLTLASFCWGSAKDGLVPLKNGAERGGSTPFNDFALGFQLASYYAQRRQTGEVTGIKPAPDFWIGNSAARDKENPTGANFYLAHLEGGVIAIVTGLRAFSRVKEHIVGDVWKINIGQVIEAYSGEADRGTHFRSRYLEPAAALFAKGVDILDERVRRSEIPEPPANFISPERIQTSVGHIDSFGNIKFALLRGELERAGWMPGTSLQVTLNGQTHPAALNGKIADGEKQLILVAGSTWHTPPGTKEGAKPDGFVDMFLNKDRAAELFRNLEKNPHTGGLPVAGDYVVITRRVEAEWYGD